MKSGNKKTAKQPKIRNWLAVQAHFKTGAGNHGDKKKYNRKSKHKVSYAKERHY